MRYAIDPGHGGHDSGAIGPTALREKDAAFEISLWVEAGLAKLNHEVFLTRAGDAFVELEDRAIAAAEWGAEVLVSIHCNAFSDPAAHGYELWTTRGETRADPIAENVYLSIGGAFPQLRGRADTTDGDHDKEAGFKVLVASESRGIPALLVETAFISNFMEERWLRDVGWQMRMAGAIISGLGR